MKYLKKFSTHSEYEAALSSLILPNVSFCKDTPNEVHYNPFVPKETRVVVKFNVTDTSNPTPISFKANWGDGTSGFSSIEIDGVEQPSVVSAYTFTTTGEHTVKYTLTDPTTIGNYAFRECNSLTNITIPNSVTSISKYAFYECSGLTGNLSIPSGVTSIGEYAFEKCYSLTSITIPSGVTSMGRATFSNCSGLTSCEIYCSVLGDNTFSDCSGLTSCTIGSGVTTIGYYAFSRCRSLTSITIPNSVTSVGGEVFTDCSSLTNITSNAMVAPTIQMNTFQNVKTGGTLTVPQGSTGYDVWMGTSNYYLGKYNWTKVEQ